MNISGQSLVPVSRPGAPFARAVPPAEVSRVRRVEGEVLPAREDTARTSGGNPSRTTGGNTSRSGQPADTDTLTRRIAGSTSPEDIDPRAIEVLPGREAPDELPPAMRRALSTYVDNENLTRLDANADFLGRVDAWA